MPEGRVKKYPKDLQNMREFLAMAEMERVTTPLFIVPDTHTAQFNNELSKSLTLKAEVTPPAGEDFIDINDEFTLKITVSNVYEVSPWQPIQPMPQPQFPIKILPNVWFNYIILTVKPTSYVEIDGTTFPNRRYYYLATPSNKLKRGDHVTKVLPVKALGCASGADDPVEKIADLDVVGVLDMAAFFTYNGGAGVSAQIRSP